MTDHHISLSLADIELGRTLMRQSLDGYTANSFRLSHDEPAEHAVGALAALTLATLSWLAVWEEVDIAQVLERICNALLDLAVGHDDAAV